MPNVRVGNDGNQKTIPFDFLSPALKFIAILINNLSLSGTGVCHIDRSVRIVYCSFIY